MGKRKIEMMKFSYVVIGILAALYMLVCAWLAAEPSPAVMLTVFGAVGVGHGSANWANAKEHQSNKPASTN